MNIAFDATAILGPMSKNRGIGNYALNQFEAIIQEDTENNYFFFNCLEIFSLKSDNVSETYFYMGKDNIILKDNEYKVLLGELVKKYIKKNQIDVFYITSPFESTCHIYEKEWFRNTKVIATVYDIIPYVFKNRYLADKNTMKWYMSCIDMLRWCDKLLVISESVKTDLVHYLKFDPQKIECIWGAVDERYRVIDISNEDRMHFKYKFGINGNFIMCTGGDDDRKNIAGLIEAYSEIEKPLKEKYQLVVVCKLSYDALQKYKGLAEKYGVKDSVVFTNFVSYEDLVKLYNMADLMAFPSKYEGFGLPVVEAFSCGTPVLTSNNSSLVEIAGDAAYLVDPFSVKDIVRGLETALTDANIDVMKKRGFIQLQKFQWKRVARLTINVINTLDSDHAKLLVKECAKKKIAFFTPLPPIQSGISDYSADILKYLSKYFDIDVFIDDGYKAEIMLPSNVTVMSHNKFSGNTEYTDIVYQMGNSEYHYYMYSYINKYSGTVVLHDYNLHGAVQHKCLFKEKNNISGYEKYLLEDYPKDVVSTYLRELQSGKRGLAIHELELNGFVLNRANKIIVHSDENKTKVLQKNIARIVKKINSYAIIEDLVDNRTLKEKKNINSETVVLACFGHVHETKRAIPVLKAFIKLKRKYDVQLIFVGKLSESVKEEFYNILAINNLMNDVLVTGYIELDEFIEYIDITDICINLRYPYNGETSGSLMRILAKGKCVLVNDIGSFGEIPDEACMKLPNVRNITINEEIDAIYDGVKFLIDNPQKKKMIEKNARRYAEENLDIELVCDQYAEFITDKQTNVLTEDMLMMIREKAREKTYTEQELRMLAKTLAYCKD